MVDAEPRKFVTNEQDSDEQDSLVRLDRVAMHRAFETDKAGKTTIHVWMQAAATPDVENFESIEADVEFVLYDGDTRLGACTSRNLKFTDKDDTAEVLADSELRIESHADVTHIEVNVEAAMVTRAKTQLKLEAEGL